MRLYDTARREVVEFDPGEVVTMYTCGITPYDAAHLGHAAVYLTFDVLQRRLRDLGHETRCVRNVTDVDDDILRKARELGVYYLDLAAEEMARFDSDMAALGLLPVYSEPRATSAIADILSLIGAVARHRPRVPVGRLGLLRRDHVSRPSARLSRLDRAEMLRSPARTGGTPTTPTSGTRSTSSSGSRPCPTSRPGSHVGDPDDPGGTSSARRWPRRELGDTIDIHGGGRDLVFPHHECEIAQCESVTAQPSCATGSTSASSPWTAPKMSKSLGNLVFVADLLKEFDPMAVRLALLAHHYRGTGSGSGRSAERAAVRLERWRATASGGDDAAALGAVRRHLDLDLDTPGALAALDEVAAGGASVAAGGAARRRLAVSL